MTNHLELIAELRNWPRSDYGAEGTLDMQLRAADALEALTPRVVSTVEEVMALPEGTVLLDNVGDVQLKVADGGWEHSGMVGKWSSSWSSLPATVLYIPPVAALTIRREGDSHAE